MRTVSIAQNYRIVPALSCHFPRVNLRRGPAVFGYLWGGYPDQFKAISALLRDRLENVEERTPGDSTWRSRRRTASRLQNCLYPPPFPAARSVHSVLRKTRSRTLTDPRAPFTPMSNLCHPERSEGFAFLFSPHLPAAIPFTIRTYEKTPRGVGVLIVNQTPTEGCLSRATIGSTRSVRYADHGPLFCSIFKPFNLQTFQRRFSTTHYPPFTTHGPPPPPPELLPSRLGFTA
jgi:hypothetical protein